MNSVESGIRNFKDFLTIYNSMSESCFNACIIDLSSRNLEKCEIDCVEHCAEKYVKLNHKVMAYYVDSQQALTEKRIKEAESENQLKDSNLLAEESQIETENQAEDAVDIKT